MAASVPRRRQHPGTPPPPRLDVADMAQLPHDVLDGVDRHVDHPLDKAPPSRANESEGSRGMVEWRMETDQTGRPLGGGIPDEDWRRERSA